MPEFMGGDKARIRFLASNLKYPQAARKAGIQGMVYVTYVVEKDGSITNARLLRGIGGGCDEEAVRVVAAMPKWKPGTQRGKPVRVQYNLPIKFALDDDGESKNKVSTIFAYSATGGKSQLVDEKVYAVVEEMPEFIEGANKVSNFLKEHVRYPESARKAGIQGTVFVTFLVKKDGSLADVKIMRGIGGGCDEEAVRVVKMMKFKPGKQNGKPIDVQFNLPIKFALN